MPLLIVFAVTGLIGILLVALICYRARENRPLQADTPPQLVLNPVRFSNPGICAQILACKGYDNTGAKNQYTDVESRAKPNERLVRAFGIDNSFTTSEAKRRITFNRDVGKKIKMTEEKWQTIADLAKELVSNAVSPSNLTTVEETTFATLDSLVRSVCLKIVLRVLFQLDPFEMDDGNISIITESINNLWIQSKGTGTPSASDKSALQKALDKEYPPEKRSSSDKDPLNLIVPAYETLWRVVLSGFLQVTFVHGVSPRLRSVLARFLAKPTTTVREELVPVADASAVSVDHIVKEALRLYPSVKRVYRQFHMANKAEPENVAADIEACQRTEALWGADAQRFVPSRWINASNEAKDSYMAFGVSPFLCPAKGQFGPMLVGILIAALADRISPKDWYVKLGEISSDTAQHDLDKALSGEKPLVSDRSTYEGMRIIMK